MLLLAVACARPLEVRHQVVLGGLTLVDGMSVEVLADGKPVTPLTIVEQYGISSITFEVTGILKGETYRFPALVQRVKYASGWKETVIRVNRTWDAKEIRRDLKQGRPLQSNLNTDMLPCVLAGLWVDNRKGDAGTLRCGALDYAVPGNKAVRFTLYLSPTAIPVSFDSKPMGDIPGDSRQMGEGTVLVDPGGRHSYDLTTVWYGKDGGGRSQPERWSGQHVYFTTKHLAYVFQQPPGMTMSYQGEVPTYHVLLDAPSVSFRTSKRH